MTPSLVCFKKPPKELLLVLDAFGLAVFTAIGAQKALDLGSSYVIVIMMGMTTGVVGGMMRDILSGKVPLILRREIYATASLCGAVIFVILSERTLAMSRCRWMLLFFVASFFMCCFFLS